MSVIRYETFYSQTFFNKGVDLGPEEHSNRVLNSFRQATVEFARLDPSVGAIQYLNIVGNGVGNQWSIVFSEAESNRVVAFDVHTKVNGKNRRKIQYTLSFKLIQECRPMLPNDGSVPPRQIGAKLA